MILGQGKTELLWVHGFIIVMQLLLVNMILVIVFDVYAEVKGGVSDAPTLYEQAKEMLEERKQRNKMASIMLRAGTLSSKAISRASEPKRFSLQESLPFGNR